MSVVERISILAKDVIKLRDNAELRFGDGTLGADPATSDVYLAWDGTDLHMMSYADDAAFNVGDGTKSMDLKLFGNTATSYLMWDASADKLLFSGGSVVPNLNSTKTSGTMIGAIPVQVSNTAGFLLVYSTS